VHHKLPNDILITDTVLKNRIIFILTVGDGSSSGVAFEIEGHLYILPLKYEGINIKLTKKEKSYISKLHSTA
jgi:hypothetical protein